MSLQHIYTLSCGLLEPAYEETSNGCHSTLRILRSENICAIPKTKTGTVVGVNHFLPIHALHNNNIRKSLTSRLVTGY